MDNSIQVETLALGVLGTNCYLVHARGGASTLVIDPAAEPETIVGALERLGLAPRAVLLTHGHVDHVGAVPALSATYRIPVYVHPSERDLYLSPHNALLPWLPAVAGLPEPVSTPPDVPGLDYRIIETPGHTPGGVCYYLAAAGLLFAGDTLFRGSIGRTDLPGGNSERLFRSLREQVFSLPSATVVYPGHGEPTTLADERRGNPFLAG